MIQPDGGYTTVEGWTGISGWNLPQDSRPECMTKKLKHSHNNQQFPGIHGCFVNRKFAYMGKTVYMKFLNMNGQYADIMNKSVA